MKKQQATFHSHPSVYICQPASEPNLSEFDDLPTTQTKLLVVVQHCVHTLNPHSINWPIKYIPFLLSIVIGNTLTDQSCQNTISPANSKVISAMITKYTVRLESKECRANFYLLYPLIHKRLNLEATTNLCVEFCCQIYSLILRTPTALLNVCSVQCS